MPGSRRFHQGDMRFVLSKSSTACCRIPAWRTTGHIRLVADDRGDSEPHHRMVVNESEL